MYALEVAPSTGTPTGSRGSQKKVPEGDTDDILEDDEVHPSQEEDLPDEDEEEKDSSFGTREEIDYINSNIAEYIDFNVPWSINASYNLNRRKIGYKDPTLTQTLTFSGDLSISEKTKLSFRSGYDFKNKMLTQTSINATRDLHCWRINFSWVPFGRFQSYNLSINAVSALLQDLKLEKRSRFFDNL